MRQILGIDTGLQGGLALITEDMKLISVWDMPIVVGKDKGKATRDYDPRGILEILGLMHKPDLFVMVEKTYPRSKFQGGTGKSNWYLGAGYMLMVGLLVALKIRYGVVDPRTWQPVMFKGMGAGDSKVLSYQLAGRLYPEAELKTVRGRVLDGRADALAIAEYGRRSLLNEV